MKSPVQMYFNRRMDKENVAHLHNSANKKQNIMNFAGKWMDLENIILSEVTPVGLDFSKLYF